MIKLAIMGRKRMEKTCIHCKAMGVNSFCQSNDTRHAAHNGTDNGSDDSLSRNRQGRRRSVQSLSYSCTEIAYHRTNDLQSRIAPDGWLQDSHEARVAIRTYAALMSVLYGLNTLDVGLATCMHKQGSLLDIENA